VKVSSIDLVEAAYRVDLPHDEWSRGLAVAAERQIDYELGTIVMPYRIDEGSKVALTSYYNTSAIGELSTILREMLPQLPPDYVRQTFARNPSALARTTGSRELQAQTAGFFKQFFSPHGIHDIFIINALDPTGHGVYIGGLLGAPGSLSRRRKSMWSRVAAHVAAGYRLRRALPANDDESEAIVTPGGRIEHASDLAKSAHARELLRDAAIAMDRARTRRQRADDEAATEMWRALIAGRWSLVDRVERDGKRLFIARKNDPALAPHHALTERERQVLGYAVLGHSNKLIGYELGLSPSTIAEYLSTAATKLGLRSRAALIEAAVTLGPAGDRQPA